jgi:hypothetical protein
MPRLEIRPKKSPAAKKSKRFSESFALEKFKSLMTKNAGKHRFEGLDEGEPPAAAAPRSAAEKYSTKKSRT